MVLSNMTPEILFAFVLILQSYAIDLDYYAEDKTNVDNDNTTQEARRAGDETHINTVTDDTTAGVTKVDLNTCVTYPEDNPQEIDDISSSSVETSTKNVTKGIPMGVFEEYEYQYLDLANQSTQPALRQEFQNSTVTKKRIKDTAENDSDSLRFTDYFNLSPALETIIIKQSMLKKRVESVWYVPNNYPCWDLPFIYGRLGRGPQTSNVFLIYAGELTVEYEPQENKEEVLTDMGDITPNQWCEQEPCYGDHTLCLFPDDKISEICEDYYNVRNPNVLEQTALVNTLNSMRNRVAMGLTDVYSHLPTASNMNQIIYDYDLAKMANRWLRQCLPGPAACSSLHNDLITQLECTKSGKECCLRFSPTETEPKCVPSPECFVSHIIGCLHVWFLSAGKELEARDIECGYINRRTLNTVQIIWAETNAIGCAYSEKSNGDVRVVCNFVPGASFVVSTKYYCGIILHSDVTNRFDLSDDITDLNYLSALGIQLNEINGISPANTTKEGVTELKPHSADPAWGVNSLNKLYVKGSIRNLTNEFNSTDRNGTIGAVGRLVTRYSFYEECASKCDTEESIYEIGKPGAACVETGRKFTGLCYSYRDPCPGYRWVAILAPVALFSLILYDLFSGVVRQTNF